MTTRQLSLLIQVILMVCVNKLVSGQDITNHAIGRSAFADAERLKDSTSRDAILKTYGFTNGESIAAFNKKYEVNLPIPESFKIETIGLTSIQSGSSILALSNPTVAIDALGTFIANRFKQEINVAFLNKFKDDLDKIPYLGDFFPNSKKVLQSSDPYNYPVFLETLRQAFETDVRNLPRALPTLILKMAPGDALKSFDARMLAYMIDIKSLPDVIMVINNLAQDVPDKSPELKKILNGLALTINALYKEGTGEETFLSPNDLVLALQDKSGYLGLLIRQNEKYLNEINPQLASAISKSSEVSQMLTNMVPIYKSIAKQAQLIQSESSKGKLTLRLFIQSDSILIQGIKAATIEIEKSKLIPGFDPKNLFKILDRAQDVNNITQYILEKKYGMALLNLTDFIIIITDSTLTQEQIVLIKKYTAFIANVLSAESKDELVQALETSANPVGSYRVKRNSTFNVSFNAYAGAFAAETETYGFTAPLGIYFGWGNLGKRGSPVLARDDGKSFGFFISLLDVGAVTAFRLTDTETELADVSWSNVFSPGAYASFGFGKCPVSINLGGQLGPELKSVDSSGNPVITDKEWLWRLSVVIDIPVFDFYIKQKAFALNKK